MDLINMGQKAVAAKYELQKLSEHEKNKALFKIAECLKNNTESILSANREDISLAMENGLQESMLDRLRLTPERIAQIAEGLLQISMLSNPLGEVMEEFTRPNGLKISKVRVPLGVIGIIYESRPNVTADAFGLCFKTGNAVILKGGSDALRSNIAITNCIQEGLFRATINPYAVQLVEQTDRKVTEEFMKLKEYVDVLIPRGGAGLIQSVIKNSTIPVIETGTGNCHIFIDETADLDQAYAIICNAKTQRPGVCNACESLVIHEKIASEFLPVLGRKLSRYHVEYRGDETVCNLMENCIPATEEDYAAEFLDLILSIKIVGSIEEAIEHINHYNTKHSEAILTKDRKNAERFLQEIDAACVYVNASTRFTDGYEFGFGAEIGISTQKLHARGPMGLKELTSYKYKIIGEGQIR